MKKSIALILVILMMACMVPAAVAETAAEATVDGLILSILTARQYKAMMLL